MTELHLIRASVKISRLARWAVERGWSGRGGTSYDEGRALHHLTTEMWGPGILNCFRMLVPPRARIGSFYAYSSRNVTELHDMACSHALPEHLGVMDVDQLAGKIMPESWQVNQRLGFDLRMRPVRRLGSNLAGSNATIRVGSEIDAFLLEALREFPDASNGMAVNGRSREAVYVDWLADRLAPVTKLDKSSTRLVKFQRVRVARSQHDPEGPDATVHGTLIIKNPQDFPELLSRGVGRHRAYGYGMLLLRPPGMRIRR